MKLITSSADPEKISLTFKGILTAIIPILIIFLDIEEKTANNLVELLTQGVFLATSLAAVVQTAYGLARKITLKRWSA